MNLTFTFVGQQGDGLRSSCSHNHHRNMKTRKGKKRIATNEQEKKCRNPTDRGSASGRLIDDRPPQGRGSGTFGTFAASKSSRSNYLGHLGPARATQSSSGPAEREEKESRPPDRIQWNQCNRTQGINQQSKLPLPMVANHRYNVYPDQSTTT